MYFNNKSVKNILIVASDKHIGDLVLSLSAINKLKEHFNGNGFYVVIDSRYAEIIETIEGLDNVILYPRKLLQGKPFLKRLSIQSEFLRRLRNASADMAIDLHGGVASSTMTFLSGAPLRIGRSTAKRPYFYNHKVTLSKGKRKLESFMQIASAVGVQGKLQFQRLNVPERRETSIRNILKNEGIKQKIPIVCIHPGSSVIYKKWTEEGFAEISDWLISKGFQVVFVGGEDDSNEITNIISQMKYSPHNLGNKISLGELIALFKVSSLFIGNDSGPMHLADATGAPVIALFGPAGEHRWGPRSEKSIVLRGEQPCEPCKRKECQYEFKCIKTLSADDVKIAIERLIRYPDKVRISDYTE